MIAFSGSVELVLGTHISIYKQFWRSETGPTTFQLATYRQHYNAFDAMVAVGILVVVGLDGLLTFLVHRVPTPQLNDFPNYIIFYVYQLMMIPTSGLIILITYYARHPQIRKTVCLEYLDYIYQ